MTKKELQQQIDELVFTNKALLDKISLLQSQLNGQKPAPSYDWEPTFRMFRD